MMKKLQTLIFRLDNITGTIFFQTFLFITIVLNLIKPHNDFIDIWLKLGLISYLILWIKSFLSEKQNKEKLSFFNYFKGFNYSIILGPISLIVHLILSKKTS